MDREQLRTDFKAKVPMWGFTAAPLVDGDLVILAGRRPPTGRAGGPRQEDRPGGMAALDNPPSYSRPIVIQQAGRRVLVTWTGESVAGLDPGTGKVYWTFPTSRSTG